MRPAGHTTMMPGYSPLGSVRRQPVATKSAAARRRQVRHASILVIMGVVLAILYVWIRVQVIQLGYDVSRIRKETAELVREKDLKRAEVEKLKTPERLETIARERFGMRLPDADEVVMVTRAQPPATKEQ